MEKIVTITQNLSVNCRFIVSTDDLETSVSVRVHPDDLEVFKSLSNPDGAIHKVAILALKEIVDPSAERFIDPDES